MTTTTHTHSLIAEDADDADECECGELLCPDTLKVVDYDGDNYYHRDGSVCFLHQISREG